MNLSLVTLLPRHARYRPNHTAVVFADQRLTYVEFNARVNRTANALLAMNIGKGDKVATMLGNCMEMLDMYWAVAKIGAVIVPLSPLLRGEGLARLLNDSDAVLMLTNSNYAPHVDVVRDQLNNIPDKRYIITDGTRAGYRHYYDLVGAAASTEPPDPGIDDDDAYNIFYSSGTTGLPKGIVHTHFIRAMYASMFANAYRITPESRILHVGALIFNGAFLTLMPAFYLGATYMFTESFDAQETIEIIAREKITHIKMVPSQIVAILNAPNFSPEKLQSIELWGTVGAPLLREYKEQIFEQLPGRFYELYGLTEGFMTILDKSDYMLKPDSVGSPPPFQQIRIVDDDGNDLPANTPGEIIGRGPMMMPGYYKRPDLTAKAIRDGWLYSGDIGYLDEDGYLFLVDRKKDMMISGGVNVYPRDIEEVVAQHPAVRECAVFGIPSDKWGETPLAAVILHEGDSSDADAIKTWVNDRIEARYQKLSGVRIYEDFPRSAAGKTLKRKMREAYWQGRETNI